METLEVPWGRIPAQDFARDFVGRIRTGGPAEVTVLCRNSTETRWFAELAGLATAICLLSGRAPKTWRHYPLQGQVALYFGADIECFARTWAGRGLISAFRPQERP